MTVAELTQDVQFTMDQQGKVTAVVVDLALWQRIMTALADSEDRRLVQSLQDRLAQGPLASGTLAWESISDEFTVGDFRNSGLLGMWKDRNDTEDSAVFARQLREEAQRSESAYQSYQ